MRELDKQVNKMRRRISRTVGRPQNGLRDVNNFQSLISDVIESECDRIRKEIRSELVGEFPTKGVEHVIELVIKTYNLSIDEFQSRSRKQPIPEARMVASWLIRNKAINNKLSLSAIGKLIGNLDHSSVCHAVKTIGGFCETDVALREQIMLMINELGKKAEWNGKEIIVAQKL